MKPKKLRLYVAGPMTGLPNDNYPAFHAEARRLRKLGHHVENPADNYPQPSRAAYLKKGLAQMLTCDAVVVLPGWTSSVGATKEIALAVELEMDVFDAGVTNFETAPAWDLEDAA